MNKDNFDMTDIVDKIVIPFDIDQVVKMVTESPVEPGLTHYAESLLRGGPWLEVAHKVIQAYQEHESARRSLLLLMGRLDQSYYGREIETLIVRGLKDDDKFIREAAICATETLGPEARELLRGHQDENLWLAKYIDQILT